MEIEEVPTSTQNRIIVKRLYESGFSPNEILKLEIDGLKQRTIYHQCKLMEEGKELKSQAGPGRPKKLTEDVVLEIAEFMTENPDSCIPDVRKFLSDTLDVNMSEETIRRALHDLGLRYKQPHSVCFLNEEIKSNRLEWALKYRNSAWDKVLFSDEATFWLGKSGIARWKPANEANEYMVPKSIPKVQVWGHFVEEVRYR